MNVSTRVKTLGDFSWVSLFGYFSVEERLVKWPLSRTAGRLQEGGQIRFRDMETREPDNSRLLNLNPVLVLVFYYRGFSGSTTHPSQSNVWLELAGCHLQFRIVGDFLGKPIDRQ